MKYTYLDINNKLSYDEYLQLNQHVDKIENQTIYYINKIEEVLSNIDDFQKTTINSKQMLNDILIRQDINK